MLLLKGAHGCPLHPLRTAEAKERQNWARPESKFRGAVVSSCYYNGIPEATNIRREKGIPQKQVGTETEVVTGAVGEA